jgi:hypothetical protein
MRRRATLAAAPVRRAYFPLGGLSEESAVVKVLVFVLLLSIVGSLFSGLFFLHRDRGRGLAMARALTWRIGLSVALFAVLMASLGYSQ